MKQSLHCQGLVKLRTWTRGEGSFDLSGPMLGSASGDTPMTIKALPFLSSSPKGVCSSVQETETDPALGSYDSEWAGLGQGCPWGRWVVSRKGAQSQPPSWNFHLSKDRNGVRN